MMRRSLGPLSFSLLFLTHRISADETQKWYRVIAKDGIPIPRQKPTRDGNHPNAESLDPEFTLQSGSHFAVKNSSNGQDWIEVTAPETGFVAKDTLSLAKVSAMTMPIVKFKEFSWSTEWITGFVTAKTSKGYQVEFTDKEGYLWKTKIPKDRIKDFPENFTTSNAGIPSVSFEEGESVQFREFNTSKSCEKGTVVKVGKTRVKIEFGRWKFWVPVERVCKLLEAATHQDSEPLADNADTTEATTLPLPSKNNYDVVSPTELAGLEKSKPTPMTAIVKALRSVQSSTKNTVDQGESLSANGPDSKVDESTPNCPDGENDTVEPTVDTEVSSPVTYKSEYQPGAKVQYYETEVYGFLDALIANDQSGLSGRQVRVRGIKVGSDGEELPTYTIVVDGYVLEARQC